MTNFFCASLPRSLRVFWFLNILLGVVCIGLLLLQKYILHHPNPYNLPLLPISRGADLMTYQRRFVYFHHVQVFSTQIPTPPYAYPAPVALLYKFFYLSHQHVHRFFYSLTGGLTLVLAAILVRAMRQRRAGLPCALLFVGSALLFSFPFWLEFSLGNMEICLFLLLAAAVLAFLRGHDYAAATLIGIATALKIYPFVFFAMLFSRRRFKPIAVGVAVVLALNFVSLWLLSGSFAASQRGVNDGIAWFRSHYMLRYRNETPFDHSLFSLFKLLSHMRGVDTIPAAALTLYLAVAAITGVALYFLKIRFLPILNQILCLCVLSVLLPPTSHDYTLIHLYVPWALLVVYALEYANSARPLRGLMPAFVCFAIVFSPLTEFASTQPSVAGQIKAVTLIVLLGIGLSFRFEPAQPLAVATS